jgi:hypothetical protein
MRLKSFEVRIVHRTESRHQAFNTARSSCALIVAANERSQCGGKRLVRLNGPL